MTRRICFGVCLLALAGLGRISRAAGPAPIYDNVHIRVADPAQAADWYMKYLGAKPLAAGRVLFSDVKVVFVKSGTGEPSAGSVVDHIGLSFPNLDAKLKELDEAGIKYQMAPAGTLGSLKSAFLEDPWRVKFELLQDPDLLGFHHVHLRVASPDATLKWYQQFFGGDIARLKGQVNGLHHGKMWVLAADSKGEKLAPSEGRAIQNIAWRLRDIQEEAALFRSKGAKFITEPRSSKDPYGSPLPLWFMMIEDPDGVKVEVLQRPSGRHSSNVRRSSVPGSEPRTPNRRHRNLGKPR